jgi:hypothetical protein
MGRPTRKTAADPFEFQKLSRSEEFRKQEDSIAPLKRLTFDHLLCPAMDAELLNLGKSCSLSEQRPARK